jgi:hypothetical protein
MLRKKDKEDNGNEAKENLKAQYPKIEVTRAEVNQII